MAVVCGLRLAFTGLLFVAVGSAWAGDPLPSVSITSADTQGGEAGPNTASFTVTRTNAGNIAVGLSVNVAVTGTATRNVDYTLAPNFSTAVFIPANQLSVTMTVTPSADNLVEGSETVQIDLLQNAGVYDIDGTLDEVTLTIADDPVEVSITSADAQGGESGPNTASFTVTRTNAGNIAAGLSVNVAVTGTATRNVDYTLAPNFSTAVFIPANQLSVTTTVTPSADNLVEGSETVQIELLQNAGVYEIDGTLDEVTLTIADDPVEVSIVSADAQGGEAGPNTATFIITRTNAGNTAAGLSVNVAATGTATRNVDYTLAPNFSTAVFIPANQLSVTTTVTPSADNLVEGSETVQIEILQNIGVYQIDGALDEVTLTIADDPVEVSITSADAQGGEAGPNTASFTVTRTDAGNVAAGLSVNVAVTGSATRNVDYILAPNFSTAVFIPANQLSVTTTVTPSADNLVEGQETLQLMILQNLSVYTIAVMDEVELGIDDDVAVVTIEAADPVANEVDQEPGMFTVRRSNNGNVMQALFVNLSVSGTAVRNVDYTFNPNFSTAVTIPANELEADVLIVPVAGIPDDEGEETVILEILPGTSYFRGTDLVASIVITDLVGIFRDGFEPQQTTQACLWSLAKTDPVRFFDEGAVLLDLHTGRLWNTCGIDARFDWASQRCMPEAFIVADPETALTAFNAGLRGERDGYDDWRLASREEQATLGGCRATLVRE